MIYYSYSALVIPHQEHCIQFSFPYLNKDILTTEVVQWRFNRIVPELIALSYLVLTLLFTILKEKISLKHKKYCEFSIGLPQFDVCWLMRMRRAEALY